MEEIVVNILFLSITGLYDLSKRGIYADLMRLFVRNGHKVHIVSPLERRMGRKTEMYESGGAQVLCVRTLNIQKTNHFIEKGLGLLLLEYQYMHAINRFWGNIRFDLVLYVTPPITLNRVIRHIKQRDKARTYLLLKDIFPQGAVDLGAFSQRSVFYRLFRRKEREMYRLSDHIGCTSPANVEFVLRHNPDVDARKVHVNPNSIEVQEQRVVDKNTVREKYGLPMDRPIFIYGGNLGRPQGIDFLLQMLEQYEYDASLFFVVAGSGTEYPKIESWFLTHRPQNARLQPYLPKEEYDLLVQSCDVGMIFLDRRFTVPNTPSRLLSYIEYKMPVIIASDLNTDIGRIAEENGFGVWSESGDVVHFIANVERLMNPQTRKEMGERGYRYLLDNYTVDKTYSIIVNTLQ